MSKSLFAWAALLCAGFCQAAVYTEVGDAGDFLNPQNVAGSAITTSLTWTTGDLSAVVYLASNTLYGFQVRRSGAADGSNYYSVLVDEAKGYTSGAFKVWNGSAWVIERVDNVGDVGYYSSLGLDADNRPHIAYLDEANDRVKYAYKNAANSWMFEIADQDGNVGLHISLVIDSAGSTHLSYMESNLGWLKYALRSNGIWSTALVDMGASLRPDDMLIEPVWLPEALAGADFLTVSGAGMYTSIMANTLATTPIVLFGSDEQKKKFLMPLTQKMSFACFALTEKEAGSDNSAIQTTAVRQGDHYVINGSKTFITNAGVSQLGVVFASTDKTRGARGLSAFIVPMDLPGISVGKHENKMGHRASNTAEIFFDEVKVPAANILKREGMGFIIAMKTLDYARPAVGAGGVGVARAAFEEALKYSQNRVQFGRPIASFQHNAFKLAEMATRIRACRNLYYEAAWLTDQGKMDHALTAMAKWFDRPPHAGRTDLRTTSPTSSRANTSSGRGPRTCPPSQQMSRRGRRTTSSRT